MGTVVFIAIGLAVLLGFLRVVSLLEQIRADLEELKDAVSGHSREDDYEIIEGSGEIEKR